jgi:N12 class adenine-specific DNA methylase
MGALLDEYRQELSVRQTEPGFDKDVFKKEFLTARGKAPKINKPSGTGLPPSRGVVSDVVTSFGRGITGSAEMYLRTLRQFDPEGGKDIVRDIATKGLGALDEFIKKHPSLQPSQEAHKGLRRALTEGVESFVESASAIIPGLATGVIFAPAAPFVGAGTGAAIFALAEKDRLIEEVENFIVKERLTDKEAADLREKGKSQAIKSALVEGGFELAANTLQVITLGLFKPLKGVAKEAIKSTFGSLFKKPAKSLLRRGTVAYLKTAATEVGTETAQEALETKFRRDIGITDMGSLDAALSVIAPTLVTSLLFLGSAKGINTLDKRSIKKGLEQAVNPDGTPASDKKRKKAVDAAVAVIYTKKNKEAARRLRDSAYAYIDSGLSIDLNTELGVIEVAGQIAKDLNVGGLDVQEAEKLADGIAEENPLLSYELKKVTSNYRRANNVPDIGETAKPGDKQDNVDLMRDGGDVGLEEVQKDTDGVIDVTTPSEEIEKKNDEDLKKPQEKEIVEEAGEPTEEEIEAMTEEELAELGEREGQAAVEAERKAELEAVKKPKVIELPKRVTEFKEPETTQERKKAQREGIEEPTKKVSPQEKRAILENFQKIQAELDKVEEGETVTVEEIAPQEVVDTIKKQIGEDATKEEFQDLLDSMDVAIEEEKEAEAVAVPGVTPERENVRSLIKEQTGLSDDIVSDIEEVFETEAFDDFSRTKIKTRALKNAIAKRLGDKVEDIEGIFEAVRPILAAEQARKAEVEARRIPQVQKEEGVGTGKPFRPTLAEKEEVGGFPPEKLAEPAKKAEEATEQIKQIVFENTVEDQKKLLSQIESNLKAAEAGLKAELAKPPIKDNETRVDKRGETGGDFPTTQTIGEFNRKRRKATIVALREQIVEGKKSAEKVRGRIAGLESKEEAKKAPPVKGEDIDPLELLTGVTEEPKAKPKADPEKQLRETSIDDITALINDLQPAAVKEVEAAKAKRKGRVPASTTQKAVEKKKVGTKTATEALSEVADSGIKATGKFFEGLHELFGGASLKSFPGTIDEKTWEKAKPLFQGAWQDAVNSGKSLKEFLQITINVYGNTIKPYLIRWAEEQKAAEAVEEEVKPVDVGEKKEKPKEPVDVGEKKEKPKKVNAFKTSDISLHKDSQGNFTAEHKFQGTLIDLDFYETRALARQAAVEVLREMQEEVEIKAFKALEEAEEAVDVGEPEVKPKKKAKKPEAPKKLRLKDVGEEMFGKRSQVDNFERIKEENKKQDTGNTTKDLNRILNKAEKKKLWSIEKEDKPNTTPGAIRYLKTIRESAMSVSAYTVGKLGGTFSGTTKDRLESYAGIEAIPGDRRGYNLIAETVAEYTNAIELLDAVTANSNTVSEIHSNLVKLTVDKVIASDRGEPLWVSTVTSSLSPTGKNVLGIYQFNNAVGILESAGEFIQDEHVDKPEPKKLKRPRAPIKDMPEGTSSHRKDNPNPTPKEVLDTFGFRGIEFGEWVNSDVGRRHLNFAFDAYHDLVDTLGIPLKGAALLQGTQEDFQKGIIKSPELGMAFGSRGFGNFAAHYESTNHVINMTRDNGDGSLAHEWGHGLDYTIRRMGDLGANAVQDLKNALEVKYDIAKAKAIVNEMLTGNSYWNRRRRGSTPVEVARMFLEKEWEESVILDTNFTKEAKAIGGEKGYWNRPEEKWARAFETFIHDSLTVSSPYLVNGWVDGSTTTKENGYHQGNPYPQGEEREQFSRMFRHFMDGIEWSDENVPSMKKDYQMVAEKERLLAEEEMKKLMAKLEEMFAAMHQGEASKDGLWWYEYTVTKRANLMQPKSIAAFDDKYDGKYDSGFGAVGYTEALLPDDILSFRLKAITHDIDDSKVYLKEVTDDETIIPGDRLDTAGATGESSLGETQTEDGEAIKKGIGVPGSTTERTGENGGSFGASDTDGGASKRGEGDSDADVDSSAGGKSSPELKPGQDAILAGGNYRITPSDALGKGNLNEKFTNNIAAIRTLKLIEKEGRQASVAEQAVLVQYVGWGGMSNAFSTTNSGWQDKFKILEETLTPEEYSAARKSTTTSFYTSPEIVTAMYTALEKMGFKGGRMLEPAVGTGNFLGLIPDSIEDNMQLSAIEQDDISARITKQLYQRAGVFHNQYQKTSLPQNFYDVAISNVPFGNVVPFDAKHNQGAFKLHDYYFIKSLHLVRPGGIVAFVTSQGSMDKKNSKARKAMEKEADFIGAIRLPDTSFKDAGTKVTADIIFMRKKGGEGTALPVTPFTEVKEYKQVQVDPVTKPRAATEEEVESLFTTGGTTVLTSSFRINEYFVNNPEMMLGKMSLSGQWQESQNLISDGRDMDEALREAVEKLPTDIYSEAARKVDVDMADALPASTDLIDGNYFEENGKLYMHIAGQPAVLIEENTPKLKKKVAIIRGFIRLRNIRRDLIKSQLKEEPESAWKKHIAKLNKEYDAFVKKFGFLNKLSNIKAFVGDPEDARVLALERWDAESETATKSGIFFKKFVENKRPVTHTDNVADALPHSLDALGRVDIPHMSKISGVSEDEVIKELQGKIWNDPEIGWVTAEDYLSGNIKQKIAFAKQALKSDKRFQKNIDVLTPLIPEDVPPGDIQSALGASWIEPRDVQAFIRNLIPNAWHIHVDYIAALGRWSITPTGQNNNDAKSNMKASRNSVPARNQWGVNHRNGEFFKLLGYILNGGLPTIKNQGVVDLEMTKAAQGKLDAIKLRFSEWLWEDDGRAEKYVRKFNDVFNTDRARSWDGSHLTFPGQVPDNVLKMTKHQRDAVWRAITTGLNVYFAHEVGTGKTYIMASTIMEAKRLGMKKKAILLAVNTNILQIESEFTELYPAAKILRVNLSESNKLQRRITLNRIANEDWDAVIMNHNSFKFIQMSPEAQAEAMEEELGNLRLSAAFATQNGAAQRTVKQIEDAVTAKEAKQEKLLQKLKEVKTEVTFEELGIDMIVVDEAHNFKNLEFSSAHGAITGLGSQDGNKSTFDLWSKTRWINQKYGGGVIFASGTPVTNSVAEIYNIMKYLDPQTLRDKGVHSFDAWASTFGLITQSPEVSPEGGSFRMVTKFADFINVPELWDMVNKTMDIVKTKDTDVKVPTILGGAPITVVVPQNEMGEAYAQELVNRALIARSGQIGTQPRGERKRETGERAQDNLLSIITDGRKAAMDMRLIDPHLPDHPDTKVNKGVELAFQAWQASKDIRGATLIFADIGVPGSHRKLDKDGFAINKLDANGQKVLRKTLVLDKETNLKVEVEKEVFVMEKSFDIFQDIKAKLIKRGIPENEIAFPRDSAGTSISDKRKRIKLFKEINDGKKRIVIGSTSDMGIGVNIQERLVALVALDTDWNFKNDDQRMGRPIRQGNIMYDLKKPVAVFRVTAEKTVDAFMWGKVAAKKKTTEVVFSSSRPIDRVVKEISDEAANMQDAMALTTGDPRFMRKNVLEADVSKLSALAANDRNSKYALRRQLGGIPGVLDSLNEGIKLKEEGLAHFESLNGVKIGDTIYDLKKDSAKIIKAMKQLLSPDMVRGVVKAGQNTVNHRAPLGVTYGSVITEEVPFLEEVEVEEVVEKEVKGKKVKQKVKVKRQVEKTKKELKWTGNDTAAYITLPFDFDTNLSLAELKQRKMGDPEILKIGTKTTFGEWEMSSTAGLSRLLANTKNAIEREVKENKEFITDNKEKQADIEAQLAIPFKHSQEFDEKARELGGLQEALQGVMEEELRRRESVDPDLERFKPSSAKDVTNVDDGQLDREDEQREDDLKLSVDEKNSIVSQEKQWWNKNEEIAQAVVDNDLIKKAELEVDLEKINRRLSISKKVEKGIITGETPVSGIVGAVYNDLFEQAESILGMGKVSMELVPRAEIAALPGIETIAKEKDIPVALYREKANIKGAYQGITVNGVATRGIIKLASDGITSLEGMEHTVRHEIFHGVFRRLLNDRDQAIILRNFGNEEKASDAFADYLARKGKLLPVSVKGIFSRLKEFFKKLSNALQGRGFTSAGDIFAKAAAGDLVDKSIYAKDDIAFSIENGVDEIDLISEHDKAKKRLESLIKGATPVGQQINQGAKNVVTQNPANVMLNKDHSALVKEIYTGVKNTDIKWHERMFGLPWFLAKKFKEWNGALGIEVKREEDRSLIITEFQKKVGKVEEGEKDHHEIMSLKADEEQGVLLAVYEGDARSEVFTDDNLRKGIRLDTLGLLDKQYSNKVIKLSERQIAAYKAWQTSTGKMKERLLEAIDNLTYLPYSHEPWVEKLKATVKRHEMQRARQKKVETDTGEITAFSSLSESEIPPRMKQSDRQKFVDAFNKLLPKQAKIATLRRLMGEVVGYAPRSRQGKFVVTTYDMDGNTLWSERSEKEKDNKGFIDTQIKRQQALGFEVGKDFIVLKEIQDKASEFIFDQIQASSVERFINKALNQAKTKEKISDADINAVTEEMITLLTDEFKGRGFGSHMMKRREGFPIGGYDISNIKRRYAEYISGASGYITKQIAAYEYANLLSSIDINTKPDLYEDIAKYSGDMLRNTTRLDRISGRVRTAAFVWYLAGQLKSPIVNFTQNWILGIPLLEKEMKLTGQKGGRGIYHKAMKDVGFRKYSDQDKRFINEMAERGITGDQLTKEITGQTTAEAGKLYETAITILAKPFSLSEIFNRKVSGLARFRAAIAAGDDYRTAFDKSRKFIFDVHFLYGKLNAPSGARGGTPGAAILRTSLTFRNYTFNFLHAMKGMLSERDFSTVAKAMTYMALLGGASALPFLDGFLDMLERITGVPWRKNVKKELELAGGEILANVGIQGLPALIGADIGGSLRIHFPDITQPGKLIEESVFGVYEGLALKAVNSVKAAYTGQITRAFEIASPTFIERPLKALRQSKEGLTTTRGKVIKDPTGKAIMPTTSENIATGLGFRPSRLARMSDHYRQFGNIKKYYSDWRSDIFTKFRLAKTFEGRQVVIQEVIEYNKKAGEQKGAVILIQTKQLKQALKQRQDKRFAAFSR